jgi:hypothetical protein
VNKSTALKRLAFRHGGGTCLAVRAWKCGDGGFLRLEPVRIITSDDKMLRSKMLSWQGRDPSDMNWKIGHMTFQAHGGRPAMTAPQPGSVFVRGQLSGPDQQPFA